MKFKAPGCRGTPTNFLGYPNTLAVARTKASHAFAFGNFSRGLLGPQASLGPAERASTGAAALQLTQSA